MEERERDRAKEEKNGSEKKRNWLESVRMVLMRISTERNKIPNNSSR